MLPVRICVCGDEGTGKSSLIASLVKDVFITNKIQAVAVAKLYVAYPNRSRWTDTGLQGAIVLANDLVGNTYWLKLVDVSVSVPMHPVPPPKLSHEVAY